MSSAISERPCQEAFEPWLEPPVRRPTERAKVWDGLARLGLVILPSFLALLCYYAPLTRGGASAWNLAGDGKFYAYQLARAHEVGGRWWQLADDPQVGQPYANVAAKHPGLYEGLDVLLLSSLTGGWLSPQANYHIMVLTVLSFNGWVAGWMVYRLTGRHLWAAMAMVLISVNVTTALRFNAHLHLIKYGWVLLAMWAMWRYLDDPSPRRGGWLGIAFALVLQSSFYYGYLLGLALGGWWLVCLCAGWLTRRHWVAAGVAGLTATVVGAVVTAPVWLMSRQTLLADEQYFQHLRVETWVFGSPLLHYFISPAWRYSRRSMEVLGLLKLTSHEGWRYLGATVLLALAAYALALLRGRRIAVAQPRCLHLFLGLMALLVVLSLTGGPSSLLFDFFPSFRCYGRAGGLVMVLASVATPVIWHSLTALLPPGRRVAVFLTLLTLLGYESYVLAGWLTKLKHSPEEQHPAWAIWLAEQAPDVRTAVFRRYLDEGPQSEWHWDSLYQRLMHRHATLNGGEIALLDADLKQLGCSYRRINADGLRFIVSLGYETLVFQQEYLHDNAWILELPWLDNVTTTGAWHICRSNAQARRFPTVSLTELLTKQDQGPPIRVPADATISDGLDVTEVVVVVANSPVRLIWADALGKRVGKAQTAFYQHLLGPSWPAYHIEAPSRPGTYQLLFLDSNDRPLGARTYVVDADLQTARQALPQRALTVNTLTLDETQRKNPLRMRIENTTPYYIESHRPDPRQKGRSRFHVYLATPGPGAFHLAIRWPGDTSAPNPRPLAVPLPRDLPPYGHLEWVLAPAQLSDANQQGTVVVEPSFHLADVEVLANEKVDLRLERVAADSSSP